MNKRLYFFLVFFSLLAIDQLTKAWARNTFQLGEAPGYPWPGVFELTLTYNQGIAFGMMQGSALLVTPIAILIALAAIWWNWTHPKVDYLMSTVLAMIAAGSVGNLIDRLWMGKVTDMFWFRLIDFPVFNVADALISVAAVVLVVMLFFEPRSTHSGAKKAAASSDSSGVNGEMPETETSDVTGGRPSPEA